MKTILITGAFLLCAFLSIAQKIQVFDNISLQPVSGADIIADNKVIATTDSKGEFDLSGISAVKIFVVHPDFHTVIVMTKDLDTMDNVIYLNPKVTRLGEVIISSSRFEEKREDSPQKIDVINARDLSEMNAQNSGEALMQSGNVLVQKSQAGGGSPVIRGFEANRVLIVMDGIRLNNAIYRSGHLQSVLRVDNTMMDRIEVVYGPGSTIYGSDALGGVMHFHTRKVIFAPDENLFVTGNAFLRYASVNNENTVHATFNVAGTKFGWLFSATYSKFDDLRQGNIRNPFYGDTWKRIYYADRINGRDTMLINADPNIQKFSGYSQYNIMSKFGFRQNENSLHTLSLHYTTTSNVYRYDRLTEMTDGLPVNAEWYYGPEKMMIASYQFQNTRKTTMYDILKFTTSFQDLEESRHSRKFNKTSLREQFEHVYVITMNLDLSKDIKRNEIRYGMEYCYDYVQSTARSTNIIDGTESPTPSRYPGGGSSMMWGAAYISHNLEVNDKLIITDGVRFSLTSLEAVFADTSLMHFPFTDARQTNTAVTGNIGIIAKPNEKWRFVLFGSTGFRAPNIDDMGKVFESSGGTQLVVPNTDLKPEYTYNTDLTIEKTFNDNMRLSVTGFYTYITNLITMKPFTFNGEDSVMYDGELTPVAAMQNSDKGYIYGAGFNFTSDITDMFSILATCNYTYGRIKTDSTDYPLDHIPPVYGKVSFVVQMKKFRNEVYVMYNGWKRLEDYNIIGEDNINYATPYGMPGWMTLNFRTSLQVSKTVKFQAGIENILDQNYRVFGSGISAPGRNLIVALRANF